MVYLALTPVGLAQARQAAAHSNEPVWCCAQAITAEEFKALDAPNLTRLSYEIDRTDRAHVLSTLATIKEHHPEQTIWVEAEVE